MVRTLSPLVIVAMLLIIPAVSQAQVSPQIPSPTKAEILANLSQQIKVLSLQLSWMQERKENGECIDLTKTLSVGSTDTTTNGEVSILQRYFHARVNPDLPVTGYFGPTTLAALNKYQDRNLLSMETGQVGPRTRQELSCNFKSDEGIVTIAVTNKNTTRKEVCTWMDECTMTWVTDVTTAGMKGIDYQFRRKPPYDIKELVTNHIQGFSYDPKYEYTLRILKTRDGSEDADPYHYVLLSVDKKTLIE